MKQTLAIDGGHPVRTRPFPSWPVFDDLDVRAVVEVTCSGRWGELQGDQVKQFEQEFAAFQRARYGICIANGTAGLQIALHSLGVGPGDEVITSPYTFVATPNAALSLAAIPVFVDVSPDDYLIDTRKIEAAITGRTRAILPVHIAGCPVDMDAITDIARRHGLPVVEDACQAWGAEWRGQKVGAIGDAGVFSFQASKNLTAGEGGIVVTNDADLAEKIWSVHNVGRRSGGEWYEHVRLGWNYRMTEWQGAILRVQLTRLPEQMAVRDQNARYLAQQLAQIGGIEPLRIDSRVTRHAWHLFILRYREEEFAGLSRNDFVDALLAEGVPCTRGYHALNRTESVIRALREAGAAEPGPCPIAEHSGEHEGVWLAHNLLLGTRDDMDSIVEAIAKIKAAKRD